MKKICSANQGGFTLAEAMIATVVLSIAAAGILVPFAGGAAVRAEGMRATLAARLAADLMEEILNTSFEEVVAGYDGYSEAEGQVKDSKGAVFTDLYYADFSRDASCAYVYASQQSGTAQPIFILATVRVSYRGGEVAVVNRLISK
ncbi:MAG: type IV pilus modification PilV family protein [Planctomycetota bacterium]